MIDAVRALILAADTSGGGVPIWAYVLSVLGVGGIITGFISYRGRARETSGRIDTTEAAKLWDEAGVIRNELRDALVEERKEKEALSNKVSAQEGKIDLLNTQLETMRDKHAECQQNELVLRARVETLEKAIDRRGTTTARKRAAPRKRT